MKKIVILAIVIVLAMGIGIGFFINPGHIEEEETIPDWQRMAGTWSVSGTDVFYVIFADELTGVEQPNWNHYIILDVGGGFQDLEILKQGGWSTCGSCEWDISFTESPGSIVRKYSVEFTNDYNTVLLRCVDGSCGVGTLMELAKVTFQQG